MREKDSAGKFVLKSGTYRKTRSIRATDNTWQAFSDCAANSECSTADLLEDWVAAGQPCITQRGNSGTVEDSTLSQVKSKYKELIPKLVAQKKSAKITLSNMYKLLFDEELV